MKVSIVDLRHRTAEILAALDRREQVTLTSHGKVRGTIIPVGEIRVATVAAHPFFGLSRDDGGSVTDIMQTLRAGRADAV